VNKKKETKIYISYVNTLSQRKREKKLKLNTLIQLPLIT